MAEVNSKQLKPSWLEVEKSIIKEDQWLKNNITPYRPNTNPLNYSDDNFYRLISILIISGKIQVSEYQFDSPSAETLNKFNSDKKHGADWHNTMIEYFYNSFLKKNYKVNKKEPPLYYGFADLLAIKNDRYIYLEIHTINIFKLWINLLTMKNIIIINVLPNKIIKFQT